MSLLEIKHLQGNTYYIPCPTNIGIYVIGQEATIIDSGLDKEIAKKILKLIMEKGWILRRIINTHSHADHIGGNAYLVEKTNCEVAAPSGEVAHIEDTLLEPSFLYGGFPYKVLRNRFLMAKPTHVDYPIAVGFLQDTGLEIIDLLGHSMNMIGVRTPDDVVFIADSLLPENIVIKYPLFYLWDVEAHLKTLEGLKCLEASFYVPSHGDMIKDVTLLVEVNKDKVQEIIRNVLILCSEAMTTEQIIENLCRSYEINLNATQYVLISNTIKSYLAYLYNTEQLITSYEGYKMSWIKKH